MGNPTKTPYGEAFHDGGFIVSEVNGHLSRDAVTLAGAAVILPGTVLGKQITGTTAVAAALGTNIGNGTFGTITLSAGALPGAYSVEFNSATQYTVSNPSGVLIGHGVTGTAYSAGGIGFTITAGGTAFAPADLFTVTVAAGTGYFVPLTLSAADGSNVAAGILFGRRDTTLANKTGVAVVRYAEVNASELIWPTGATALQIAAGTAQLLALGIVAR